MRILRQCFTPTHSIYLVYDETKSFDEEANLLEKASSKEKAFLDIFRENLKDYYGKSWGFVKVCYFFVTNKGGVTVEFDGGISYNLQEIKKIMSKIYKTRLRLIKKWNDGKINQKS